MGKFRKEPYITQRQGRNGLWTFQVFIRSDYATVTKSFSEKTYGSARIAFDTAVAFKNKTLVDINNNTILRASNITVKEVFEEHLETTTSTLRTKEYHEMLFNKYIGHKDTKIQELTKADILEDLNKMVDKASNDTIGRVYAIWKNDIIGHALFKEYIQKDLMLSIRKPESHLVKTRKDVTTDRDTVLKVEECILKSVSNKYDARVIVCLIETLYYTGMRPAEVEVLTIDDIKDDYISVTKELGSNMNKSNVVRKCKTENSVRKVPIHPNLRIILNDLMSYALHDNLFAREDGSYMNSTWIGNIIRNICKANGLEFNLYRLRHNMATSLVTNNVDTKTTMEILGHAHYDMSLYYANSNEELKEKAVKLLS